MVFHWKHLLIFFIPNLLKSLRLLVPSSIKWGRNSSAYLTVNWGEVSASLILEVAVPFSICQGGFVLQKPVTMLTSMD